MNIRWCYFLLIAFLTINITTSCSKDEDDENLIETYRINKEAGEMFLIENLKKPGVKELSTGLQYLIIKEGTGIKPTVSDSVNVTYTGKLIDGTIFSSTSELDGNSENLLISEQIRGWREGLKIMPEGSVFTLYIPYYLGYGSQTTYANYDNKTITIQPYSVLIFEITLNKVIVN